MRFLPVRSNNKLPVRGRYIIFTLISAAALTALTAGCTREIRPGIPAPAPDITPAIYSPYSWAEALLESPSRALCSYETLLQKVKDKERITILDLRKREDYDRGHIPAARSLPWGENPADILDIEPPVYIYSYTREDALEPALLLRSCGLDAWALQGGWPPAAPNESSPAEPPPVPVINSIPHELEKSVAGYFLDLELRKDTIYKNFTISREDFHRLLQENSPACFLISPSASSASSPRNLQLIDLQPAEMQLNSPAELIPVLPRLPKTKRIFVLPSPAAAGEDSWQGGVPVTLVLRLLGYDAVRVIE